jgi:lauroyl/myristoyl acyltransferase
MAGRFQDLINSRLGVGTALAFSRIIPTRLGYWLGNILVDRISSRKDLEMVQAVRLNQWVVSGQKATSHELDILVKRTFRNTAHTLFDVYRTLSEPSDMEKMIIMNPAFESIIKGAASMADGIIIVSGHMNQVDLMALYAGYLGARPFGLMFSSPTGGYEWQNDIRKKFGIESHPTNKAALKKAIERLKAGGTVATAVDRPLPSSRRQPLFFGNRAALPLHYIMLALKTDVPIVVASPLLRQDGKYDIKVSDPIYMDRFPDRETSMLFNAEKVLKVIEKLILDAPHQWAMYYPVWPSLMDKVPVN